MFLREIPPQGADVLHRFVAETVMVGRAADADVCLQEPALSRHHLRFRREDGGWMAEDQGSKNGTSLNGRPLLGSERLQPGDRMRLGQWMLVFEGEADTSERGASSDAETRAAGDEAHALSGAIELVGVSAAMAAVRESIADFAPTELPVLLRGEPGTGKELAAALIHEHSTRRPGPFVPVNCPAIPKDLFESALFGVAKGAATGVEANEGHVGRAAGGTLFLDEVGELEIGAQAKLLRFLESGAVDVVGGQGPTQTDVRVVAATNRDLEAAVEEGRFRSDLFDRLAGAEILLPALRERPEDIPVLVGHFAERARPRPAGIEPETIAELKARAWPGNVRELRRSIESAAARARGASIRLEHLPASRGGDDPVGRLTQRLTTGEGCFWSDLRDPYLARTLSRADAREVVRRIDAGFTNWKEAAAAMGIETEHKKLLQFLLDNGLRPKDA